MIMHRRGQGDADDGRTVADMSMLREPWYRRTRGARDAGQAAGDTGYTPVGVREWMRTLSGSLLAGLLVAGVFIAAGAVFILFCTNVWLR